MQAILRQQQKQQHNHMSRPGRLVRYIIVEAVTIHTADMPMYVWCAKAHTPSHSVWGAEGKATRWNPRRDSQLSHIRMCTTYRMTGNSLLITVYLIIG